MFVRRASSLSLNRVDRSAHRFHASGDQPLFGLSEQHLGYLPVFNGLEGTEHACLGIVKGVEAVVYVGQDPAHRFLRIAGSK